MKIYHEGRVAFITGAASGIGRATAIAFARAGANVALLDINSRGAEETARIISDLRERPAGTTLVVPCDVSKHRQVRDAVNRTVEVFGRIDAAFNAAGVEGDLETLADCAEENWDHVMEVNLKGVWLCMKYELLQMLKQGKGAIVNCSSVSGLVAVQTAGPYVASKHGVLGLTKAAALENAQTMVRINAVCPGACDTPMIERLSKSNPEMLKGLLDAVPAGRLAQPSEVAEVVLWLCSDASSFVMGHALAADGGWLAF